MTRVWFTALACEKTLITMHLALNVDVIGPENILFAGTSLHLSLSARKFYRLGALKGLIVLRTDL